MRIKLTYSANEHGLQYSPVAIMMLAEAFNSLGYDVELELDPVVYQYDCKPSESITSPQFDHLKGVLKKLGLNVEEYDWSVDYSLVPATDVYAVTTAFGCTRKCTHCPDYKHNTFRTRSVHTVVSEIIQLYDMGVRYFEFTDNNIYNDIKHFKTIISYIPKGMFWGALINIDSCVTETDLKFFRNCGCRRVYTGLESLNLEDVEAFGKSFKVEPISFIKRINAIIPLNVFIIRGLPNETKESWASMIDFLNTNGISYTINHFCVDGERSDIIFTKSEADMLETLDNATTCKNLSKFLADYL